MTPTYNIGHTWESHGHDFRVIRRRGNVVVVERRPCGLPAKAFTAYEVARLVDERYPDSSEWQARGKTFMELHEALDAWEKEVE
jgi:hypothetical protein